MPDHRSVLALPAALLGLSLVAWVDARIHPPGVDPDTGRAFRVVPMLADLIPEALHAWRFEEDAPPPPPAASAPEGYGGGFAREYEAYADAEPNYNIEPDVAAAPPAQDMAPGVPLFSRKVVQGKGGTWVRE